MMMGTVSVGWSCVIANEAIKLEIYDWMSDFTFRD